jgi:hypothetical protein
MNLEAVIRILLWCLNRQYLLQKNWTKNERIKKTKNKTRGRKGENKKIKRTLHVIRSINTIYCIFLAQPQSFFCPYNTIFVPHIGCAMYWGSEGLGAIKKRSTPSPVQLPRVNFIFSDNHILVVHPSRLCLYRQYISQNLSCFLHWTCSPIKSRPTSKNDIPWNSKK